MKLLTFPQLQQQNVLHGFTLRDENAPLTPEAASTFFTSHGFTENSYIFAQQTHSGDVACVHADDRGKTIPIADALITNERGITLVVRTADCGPVFLYDPQKQAIGLIHSGRKGTEARITVNAIQSMMDEFESEPSDIITVLAPCIRPPQYDVDFASDIALQAKQMGIQQFYDCGLNTGADLQRFYSYRVEKGKTGRHFSALCLV